MRTTFAKMTLPQLQEWYANICAKHEWTPAKRGSSDIDIMRDRCLKAYNASVQLQKDEAIMARKAKAAAAQAAQTPNTNAAEGGEGGEGANQNAPAAAEAKAKGRKSKFSGTNLWYVHETNKRQENSWGNRSMQCIIDQPGISYEDYLKAGGRTVDLAWDVERDNVVFSAEAVGPMREKFAAAAAAKAAAPKPAPAPAAQEGEQAGEQAAA